MKKFYYLIASMVLFIGIVIACVNPSIEAEELQALEKIELQAKMGKSDICHLDEEGNYFVINIADASYDKHMAHGDKALTILEGTHIFHYELNGVNYPHKFVFSNFDGESFNVTGYYPSNDYPDDLSAYNQYTYPYKLTKLDEFGNFKMETEGAHPTWTITGTYSECEGFVLDSPWSATPWVF